VAAVNFADYTDKKTAQTNQLSFIIGCRANSNNDLTGPVDPKFQVEGAAPHQPFFFSEN